MTGGGQGSRGPMPHFFSPAACRCFLVEMRCARGGQPIACASHSSAGACLRCVGFEMYEIGKGKGSGRAKFGPCWAVLVQDFAANFHHDHRSSPEGWAPRCSKAHAYLELGELVEAGDRSLFARHLSLPPDWPPMAAPEGICTLHILDRNRLGLSLSMDQPARRRCSHDAFFSYINAPSEVP